VSRAAGAVIFEVRRQFREHPGIMDYTEKPEYGKVVDIVTRDSLRELITPGLLAVLTPIAVGFALGIGALGSYLAGTIATGALMAVFLLASLFNALVQLALRPEWIDIASGAILVVAVAINQRPSGGFR